jgi:hypothetical protein
MTMSKKDFFPPVRLDKTPKAPLYHSKRVVLDFESGIVYTVEDLTEEGTVVQLEERVGVIVSAQWSRESTTAGLHVYAMEDRAHLEIVMHTPEKVNG